MMAVALSRSTSAVLSRATVSACASAFALRVTNTAHTAAPDVPSAVTSAAHERISAGRLIELRIASQNVIPTRSHEADNDTAKSFTDRR